MLLVSPHGSAAASTTPASAGEERKNVGGGAAPGKEGKEDGVALVGRSGARNGN